MREQDGNRAEAANRKAMQANVYRCVFAYSCVADGGICIKVSQMTITTLTTTITMTTMKTNSIKMAYLT